MGKQFNAYLFFDGNCADAFGFYEKTLGGKLSVMKYADAPPTEVAPPGMSPDRVMHAALQLDDGSLLMGSDTMGQPYQGIHGVSISLSYTSTDEARKIFAALALPSPEGGGKIEMPLEKAFWAELFGVVTDRFGVSWMVSGGQQMGG
jgi:PhnB protein